MTNKYFKIQELKDEKQELEAELKQYEDKHAEELKIPNLIKSNLKGIDERIQRLEGETTNTSNSNDQAKKESWEVFLN